MALSAPRERSNFCYLFAVMMPACDGPVLTGKQPVSHARLVRVAVGGSATGAAGDNPAPNLLWAEAPSAAANGR
jgi:hypothetical protein